MSEDSKQLSVAELLARNGQQGASSAGGGRRRRGGRGISVAELTGDMPAIGSGQSSHAAPDPVVPDEPVYETPSYEPPAPEPVSYPPAPDPSSYSPMSGPISMYDPLAAYAQPEPQADPLPGRSNRVMPGREMPGSRYSGPADPLSSSTPVADLYAPSPNPYAPSPNPYAAIPQAEEPPAPTRSGRRRRHAEPEEETTEVRPPLRDLGPMAPPDRGGPNGRPTRDDRNGGGRAARRRAAEADEVEVGPSTAAWSPSTNGYADAPPEQRTTAPWPDPDPKPPLERRSSQRNGSGSGERALPAWSARRHKPAAPPHDDAPESGGLPTSAWSLASQDQQLLSGQTVAGDLLRDGVERAERAGAERTAAAGRGKRGRSKQDAPPEDELDIYDGKTDFYEPVELVDEDDDEHLDDHEDQDEPDHTRSARRSRAARKAEYDANRRQWLILGGQSTGAAIAGMLLFKGFESMWEMLPWVALALAMIVILGLVALVRILRRTDDVLSTVIAVVVGVFVTLGPLAFLLSTN